MKQLKEDLKNQTFHPVYLLYGEEDYLKRMYRDRLKKAVLGDGDEMNYSYFEGKDIDFPTLREAANTLPFFSDHRIIVVENSRMFKNASEMADYLPQMPDTTVVVFVEKEVDKRNKLYKYVNKNGVAVEMTTMTERELKAWVAVILKQNGRKMLESTASYFLEQVENSMTNVKNELDKLISYTEGREEIARDDIDAVCSVQVTGRIFQMMDAVASGNQGETLRLYHDLLTLRESPMSMLYLLTRHFNVLLQVLDDGRITDSQGRTVDFKNTIIILTSNLGSDIILEDLEKNRANGKNELSAEARDKIDLLLKRQFRPEFLNRLDDIVYYKSLTKDEIGGIVDLMLADLRSRLADKQLKLVVTDAAKSVIVDDGYDPIYGARPLKRYIQANVETMIAKEIIGGNHVPGDTLTVDAENGKLVLR